MNQHDRDSRELRELCAQRDAARATVRQQSERIAELEAERDNLHTTMFAAAVAIQAHWDAHCDAEGYGPSHLMHRLERGIASQYGYDAATLQRVEAERDRLRLDMHIATDDAAQMLASTQAIRAERDQLRAEVIANRERDALKLAALHIHSEMRSIVQAGGSNEAIGREFRKRVILDVEDEVVKLRAEVERLRPNAERYEWLRDNLESEWAICEWQDDPDGLGYYRDARASHIVDAAIDLARTTHKDPA